MTYQERVEAAMEALGEERDGKKVNAGEMVDRALPDCDRSFALRIGRSATVLLEYYAKHIDPEVALLLVGLQFYEIGHRVGVGVAMDEALGISGPARRGSSTPQLGRSRRGLLLRRLLR